MNKKLKITLWVTLTLLLFYAVWFIWVSFENPYLRLHLIGTDYIENSDKLDRLYKQENETYYLIKKYKYSKDIWLLGYGNGGKGSKTIDYYGQGIADKNKDEILPPKYEVLYVLRDYETNEIYIRCHPFLITNENPIEDFRIENNKAIAIQRKS